MSRITFDEVELITRKYMDLSLFITAFEQCVQNGFDIELPNSSPSTGLQISCSLYTLNPTGYHIGYEEYVATLSLVPARLTETSPMSKHPQCKWLVDIDSLDNVDCVAAPPSEECDCEECDSEECHSELYTSPLDDDDLLDFAYQEFQHIVETVTNYPVCWMFVDGTWCIVDGKGETLYESDWTPGQ